MLPPAIHAATALTRLASHANAPRRSTPADVHPDPPYGGLLVNLLEPADSAAELARHASTLPSITLSERASCDRELLATGAFSPLDRFMADFSRVVDEMRLADGTLFPIPVTLSVAERPELGGEVALRGSDNALLAVMTIGEVFEWDVDAVAAKVFGTTDHRHSLRRHVGLGRVPGQRLAPHRQRLEQR